ncbi:MAG: anti-repressor SinI family protein [Bacillus sp. (in: Bacteria)]|nr:anti-repressor SinI family protein [Bacillus sp. (in: firmicutes)]
MEKLLERNQRNMQLDKEWVELLRQAKALGLTPTDVRIFLASKKRTKLQA